MNAIIVIVLASFVAAPPAMTEADFLDMLREKPCAVDIVAVAEMFQISGVPTPPGFYEQLALASLKECGRSWYYGWTACYTGETAWLSSFETGKMLDWLEHNEYDPCPCLVGERWTYGFGTYRYASNRSRVGCNENVRFYPHILDGGQIMQQGVDDDFPPCALMEFEGSIDCQCLSCEEGE